MNKYFIAFFFAILFVNIPGCSKQALFEKAIAYERDRSHLFVKTQGLSFGKVVYLTNNKDDKEETIVMLHGFGADKDTWVRFTRNLRDDYRIEISSDERHTASDQWLPIGLCSHILKYKIRDKNENSE